MEVDMLSNSKGYNYPTNNTAVVEPQEVKPQQKPTSNTDKSINLDEFVQSATDGRLNGKGEKREPERDQFDVLKKAVSEANQKLASTNRELHYSVHEKTNSIMIKILDSKTKEVIREIPPESKLDSVAKMWELAGLIVDKKL